MGDLSSALNTAFDETLASDTVSTSDSSTPEPVEQEAEGASESAPEATKPAEDAEQTAPKAQDEEPTGDVLLDKLTPEQIAEIKRDPKLRAIYKGLMQSYTPRMQQFSEQAKLWDALNNPQTQKQAVEALA